MIKEALNNINKKRFTKNFSAVFVLSMLIIFVYANGVSAYTVFSLDFLSVLDKIKLFLMTLFDFNSSFNLGSKITSILTSILIAISVALTYELYLIKKTALGTAYKGLSGAAYFLAIIGLGCASCKVSILFTILTALGAQSVINFFPLGGKELTYFAILLLIGNIFYLLKKLKNPYIC